MRYTLHIIRSKIMIWVDRELKKIKERNLPLEWVDDMKTPSGRIHVGALRGVVIHDLIYKVLVENKIKARFTWVFEDHDPMDAIPAYLDYKKWEKYAGMPLYKIPSPEKSAKSFGEYYAKEFQKVFESLDCHPEIIWMSEFYKNGKMNEVVREALDNAAEIRTIYLQETKVTKPDDWHPFNVACENCGKISTTYVYEWDGTHVFYRCNQNVAWAKSCGHTGKISPFDGNGKMPWRVEWAAKWKAIGITIEGAGKDHMSAGGSHEMSSIIAEKIFHYPVPYSLAYEFIIIGGRKMSSSKGTGAPATEVAKILPPDLLRFLIVRSPVHTTIDFDPNGDTIPNLFDDYDRCLNAYFSKIEENISEGKEGEVTLDFARIIELSHVRTLPKKRHFLPRFRTIAKLIQTKADLIAFFEEQKGGTLTPEEKMMIKERSKYAEVYLRSYADEVEKITFLEKLPADILLSSNQKVFLSLLADELSKVTTDNREEIQEVIFLALKKSGLSPKEVFSGFYTITIGKQYGPKAADLILEYGAKNIIKRLEEATSKKNIVTDTSPRDNINQFSDKAIFSIDSEVASKFPTTSIGIAIIKGVSIKKTDSNLQNEIEMFIETQKNLTTEALGQYPEVISYRKAYKATGVDWHSRRPSPEALLRRVALKKSLYNVNTCVDAYNLVVMKNRISAGAFDLDSIKFPTVLRFPKDNEEILLLGDDKPTKYKPTELAYFDRDGGYNIDLNYRDAQRTAITEQTKNLLINVDGIYDITPKQVSQTLKEVVDNILKYCGGTVEILGISTAK